MAFTDWQAVLRNIRDLQTELLRLAPYRDACLVPNPPASEDAISTAESRLGCALPPSYRQFLAQHDGWPRFFDGARLLGTEELGRRLYADLAAAALDASERSASVAKVCSLVPASSWKALPFGVDAAGTTLFCFDPRTRRPDGEMAVIAWIQEIGLRCSSFQHFLETVLEFCQADLDALEEPSLLEIA